MLQISYYFTLRIYFCYSNRAEALLPDYTTSSGFEPQLRSLIGMAIFASVVAGDNVLSENEYICSSDETGRSASDALDEILTKKHTYYSKIYDTDTSETCFP